jgi:hypothetical protein
MKTIVFLFFFLSVELYSQKLMVNSDTLSYIAVVVEKPDKGSDYVRYPNIVVFRIKHDFSITANSSLFDFFNANGFNRIAYPTFEFLDTLKPVSRKLFQDSFLGDSVKGYMILIYKFDKVFHVDSPKTFSSLNPNNAPKKPNVLVEYLYTNKDAKAKEVEYKFEIPKIYNAKTIVDIGDWEWIRDNLTEDW